MKKIIIIPILLILLGTGCSNNFNEDGKDIKIKEIEQGLTELENKTVEETQNDKLKNQEFIEVEEKVEQKTEEEENLTQKENQPKVEEPKINEVTQPSEAVVEIGENGSTIKTTQKIPSPQMPEEFINPKTGELYTTDEYIENANVKCASQNKIRNTVMNNDGTVDCITYNQACQQKFGPNSIQFGNVDGEGLLNCGCKIGYVQSADKKSCQKKQQIIEFGDDPYGVFDDGVVYSPEQRAQIECAYYGYNCEYTAPVTVYDSYQDTPPPAPTQTNVVNCSNYQIEKANLDQQYSNNGTLFSGARVSAQNALKEKYPGCF